MKKYRHTTPKKEKLRKTHTLKGQAGPAEVAHC